MKQFLKTLVMFAISFIATSFTTNGIPEGATEWTIMGVTVFGALCVYTANSYAFPSISIFGVLDLKDLLKGLILGVGTGVSNWIATIVAGVELDWKSLLSAVLSVILGYFMKNFASGKKEESIKFPEF